MEYPNQNIGIEVAHGSRDHAIVSDTVKNMFNLDIESTDKRILFVVEIPQQHTNFQKFF